MAAAKKYFVKNLQREMEICKIQGNQSESERFLLIKY